jgi:hypothetical protein
MERTKDGYVRVAVVAKKALLPAPVKTDREVAQEQVPKKKVQMKRILLIDALIQSLEHIALARMIQKNDLYLPDVLN